MALRATKTWTGWRYLDVSLEELKKSAVKAAWPGHQGVNSGLLTQVLETAVFVEATKGPEGVWEQEPVRRSARVWSTARWSSGRSTLGLGTVVPLNL